MTFSPDCMTPDELTLWGGGSRVVPCVDCPVWFAAEMRRRGCCNSKPQPVGRPRVAPLPARPLHGRGNPYANDAERIAARRETWREAKRRRRYRDLAL